MQRDKEQKEQEKQNVQQRADGFRLSEEARRRIEQDYYDPAERQSGRQSAPKPVQPIRRQIPKPVWKKPAAADRQAGFGGEENFGEEYLGQPEAQVPKKPKRHRMLRLMGVVTIFCVFVLLLNIAFFYYRGQIWFNEPRKRDFPVRGAVVTQDLGKIDWKIMSQQTISFVYIRATKGTALVDEQYKANRKNARKQDLLVGFWHEYDFRADGEKQAENFIEECGELDGYLRPMVKLTKYGIYNLKMKNADDVRENLQAFLDRIHEEYGRNAVIMCDSACYRKYVEPYFDDYTLWFIDHFGEPDEDTGWALWEFNPRVRTEGYENNKEYFPLSVYRREKDIENFKKYLLMKD